MQNVIVMAKGRRNRAAASSFDEPLKLLKDGGGDGAVAGLVKASSVRGFEVCVCVFACVTGLTAFSGEGVWRVWLP